MPVTHQKSFQIARRRETVSRLYAEGLASTRIAEQLDVSVSTVAADLKAVRKQWLKQSLCAIDRAKARELAKIDRLEAAAWEGWARSCRDAETTKVTADGDKRRAEKTTKGQPGDPKFLERVQWCINKRCEILKIDSPAKISESQKSESQRDADEASLDERRQRVVAIVDQLLQRVGSQAARTTLVLPQQHIAVTDEPG